MVGVVGNSGSVVSAEFSTSCGCGLSHSARLFTGVACEGGGFSCCNRSRFSSVRDDRDRVCGVNGCAASNSSLVCGTRAVRHMNTATNVHAVSAGRGVGCRTGLSCSFLCIRNIHTRRRVLGLTNNVSHRVGRRGVTVSTRLGTTLCNRPHGGRGSGCRGGIMLNLLPTCGASLRGVKLSLRVKTGLCFSFVRNHIIGTAPSIVTACQLNEVLSLCTNVANSCRVGALSGTFSRYHCFSPFKRLAHGACVPTSFGLKTSMAPVPNLSIKTSLDCRFVCSRRLCLGG